MFTSELDIMQPMHLVLIMSNPLEAQCIIPVTHAVSVIFMSYSTWGDYKIEMSFDQQRQSWSPDKEEFI